MGEKHWFAVHEYGIYQQTVIVLDTTLKCVDSICVVGVRSVKYKPCALAVEEAAKISDMTCEEDPEILKTRELLSEAQLLTRDIEELLDLCTSTGPSNQRRNRMIQQDCQASIEEDGETLVIEGFRFESAASREDLRRLSSQAGAGGRQGDT